MQTVANLPIASFASKIKQKVAKASKIKQKVAKSSKVKQRLASAKYNILCPSKAQATT